MRGPYRRHTLPKGGNLAVGRTRRPRWNEGSQRAPVSHPDAFPWLPGERVDGLARKRPFLIIDNGERHDQG
jgi:hypothetical protein